MHYKQSHQLVIFSFVLCLSVETALYYMELRLGNYIFFLNKFNETGFRDHALPTRGHDLFAGFILILSLDFNLEL